MSEFKRHVTIVERPRERPYMLTWAAERIQIEYFSAYLAAVTKLETLHERGIQARLYAELTVQAYRRVPIEEPIPPGMTP